MAYDFDKWFASGRRPVRRHRIVPWLLLALMLLAAGTAIAEVIDGGPNTRNVAGPLPFMATIFIAVIGSPFARDGWIGPRIAKVRDEFERDALGRATANAYAVLLSLILLASGWLWLATLRHWPMPHTALDWSSFGFAFLSLGGGLPIFFAEIMVPLPPADDEDEDLL